uniref:Triokinase/FMN cyclase n=1 Tax=Timema douglasi TaxID=61478 RepID=A0A7R8VL32_TIMDO|nr:unnamed protein product [Timema douglasi]
MATKLPKPKKMLNTVSSAVDDALAGLALINKGLVILENERVVMRRDHASMIGKVKLISGGGSGHEPTPTGFVGQGMLTAVVMGDIFMAPPTSAILKTIKEIGKDHHEGVLLIVHNYMGDRLNFGIALERVLSEGMRVKMLVVGEDCSMPDVPKVEGRRGLTGCILIHKMAGAMAEEGRSLEDIFQRCKSLAVSDMATINVGWNLTSTLARNAEVPLLADEEAELGLGFNYEPGIHTIPLGTTAEVVQIMLAHMINADSMTHISLDTNCGIALLINNVGGSSKLEEQVFAMETLRQLLMNGYKVKRSYSGSFMTSLDMLGFSITLLNLSSPDILRYLDAPTSAPAWPQTFWGEFSAEDDSHDNLPIYVQGRIPHAEMEMDRRRKLLFGPHISEKSGQSLLQVLSFAADALIASETQLNVNDMDGGDGDCGTTLRQGAVSVKQALNAGHFNSWRPYAVLEIISFCCERSMGGITGALYSIFFAAASKPFYAMREDAVVNAQSWLDALQAGTKAVMLYGQAEEGDRTMVDSLVAAATALKAALDIDPDDHVEAARSAAMAAETATQTTIRSEARIGKARTFKDSMLKACQSLTSKPYGYISNDHDSRVSYLSTQYPTIGEVAALVRQACIRSLSCEVTPGREGPLYFGDKLRGHVLSHTFSLKDAQARGFQRWFSIIVLMKDKYFLLNSWPFLVDNITTIITELQERANKAHEEEQSACPQRAFRLLTVNSPDDSFLKKKTPNKSSRPITQLTADELVFPRLHLWFTWILRAGSTRMVEYVAEGLPTMNVSLDWEQQEETAEGFTVISTTPLNTYVNELEASSSYEVTKVLLFVENVREFRQLLGHEGFLSLAYNLMVGHQVVVRGCPSELVTSIIKCLKVLVPRHCYRAVTHSDTYLELAECNLLGLEPQVAVPQPSATVLRLDILRPQNEDHQQNLEMYTFKIKWGGSMPTKCPTILLKMEKAIENSKLCENVLRRHFISLKEEWLNIAKVIHRVHQANGPNEDIAELLRSLGAQDHDKLLLDFWATGLVTHPGGNGR